MTAVPLTPSQMLDALKARMRLLPMKQPHPAAWPTRFQIFWPELLALGESTAPGCAVGEIMQALQEIALEDREEVRVQRLLSADEAREPKLCRDCGRHTEGSRGGERHDFYMVRGWLWRTYGAGRDWLCLLCFENRLGRQLAVADLAPIQMNEPVAAWLNARRVAARLAPEAAPQWPSADECEDPDVY